MTVKELKEILDHCNQDIEILISYRDECDYIQEEDIFYPDQIQIYKNKIVIDAT